RPEQLHSRVTPEWQEIGLPSSASRDSTAHLQPESESVELPGSRFAPAQRGPGPSAAGSCLTTGTSPGSAKHVSGRCSSNYSARAVWFLHRLVPEDRRVGRRPGAAPPPVLRHPSATCCADTASGVRQ